MDEVLQYFSGDAIAADAWREKYQMKDLDGNPVEKTPTDMHLRMAKEFAKIESGYRPLEEQRAINNIDNLSAFGKSLFTKRLHQTEDEIVDELFSYFDRFQQIVPQGSIQANLGNFYIYGSLSNCFGIGYPVDSYGGIMRTDEELAQLMKRRGGVGTGLDNIRPEGATVTNASKYSTGVPTYMKRYSNTTREVAQEGRRGALIELLMVAHPDIFKFTTVKADRTSVTGANISVKFTDEFMKLIEAGETTYYCRFPVDQPLFEAEKALATEYNVLVPLGNGAYVKKINPVELFQTFVDMAWEWAEPGAAYIDTIVNYSPDGVYEAYRPRVANPCGEQWFNYDETCRLILANLFPFVINPWTEDAYIDEEKAYEVFYMQQRLGDALVDLEAEYIDRILNKIEADIQKKIAKGEHTEEFIRSLYQVEINLWHRVKKVALAGRRTGSGLTALGDMLAAMGVSYGKEDGREVAHNVMIIKMEAELDATIDMAILRGPFEGWDADKEFRFVNMEIAEDFSHATSTMAGRNPFYQMVVDEFPGQAIRMYKFGRRNVNWSNISPAGTMSVETMTTSGCEPAFNLVGFRKRKVNAQDKSQRIDLVDESGDSWQEYPVFHPKFKVWLEHINDCIEHDGSPRMKLDVMTKEQVATMAATSPWAGNLANDLSWESRIKMNAILQRYTSNAISCTVNLPKDISKETVYNLYLNAWKSGLKGLTIYREGSRLGVLTNESSVAITNKDQFGYNECVPRPQELKADYHYVVVNGTEYAVIVGLLNNNPYEVFAYARPVSRNALTGTITEVAPNQFTFRSDSGLQEITNLQLTSPDERLVTRLASLLLRQGTHPKYVVKQVEKSETYVSSFSFAVARVLKHYIPDEAIVGEACDHCGEHTMVYQEGCKKCTSCGHSKCG